MHRRARSPFSGSFAFDGVDTTTLAEVRRLDTTLSDDGTTTADSTVSAASRSSGPLAAFVVLVACLFAGNVAVASDVTTTIEDRRLDTTHGDSATTADGSTVSGASAVGSSAACLLVGATVVGAATRR